MVRHTLLEEPLKGWDNSAISEFSGLSQTGVHNQMHKLREVGLISSRLQGRWHVNVLRGGSMASSVELIAVQTRAIAMMRLAELSDAISDSESRMQEVGEEESQSFRIDIAEPGPTPEDSDRSIVCWQILASRVIESRKGIPFLAKYSMNWLQVKDS